MQKKKPYHGMYIPLIFLYISIYTLCLFANNFLITSISSSGFSDWYKYVNDKDINTGISALYLLNSAGWVWLITFQRQLLSCFHRPLFRHVWPKYNYIHFYSTCNPWLSELYYCKPKYNIKKPMHLYKLVSYHSK